MTTNPVRPVPALLITAVCSSAALAQRASLFDELAPLFPDTDVASGETMFTSDAPRGTPAGVHVLVTGLAPREHVRCELLEGDQRVVDARVFRLIDVPVEQNTGLESRTEAWDGGANPHVIRRAPFRVFEVLEPADGTIAASDEGVLALRIEVPVATTTPAGVRECTVVVSANGRQRDLSWRLTVHAVAVPASSQQSPGYTNWFSPDVIARRHGLEPWSEPFWGMLGRYADLMSRGRQNTFWLRWRDFTQTDESGAPVLNRMRLARYVELFLDRGFVRLEGGHLARRHEGDWSSPRLDLALTGADIRSERGQAELRSLLGDIREALDEIDLPERVTYVQHLADEPTPTNAEAYRLLAEAVRRALPGVDVFDATMTVELVGAVDQWCPQVQEFQRHRAFFEARKAAGEKVWVYTCLAPGGPWLNRLLDQERLRPVYLGWSLVAYDLDGFLHWGLNHYRPGVDPYRQSVVPHGQGPPNFLPAGDSHVVYPGPRGPLSGQRFEAHRIGMEDAELLGLLRRRDRDLAAALVARVFRAFDDYETDIAEYRLARRDLLRGLAGRDAEPAEREHDRRNGRPATPRERSNPGEDRHRLDTIVTLPRPVASSPRRSTKP